MMSSEPSTKDLTPSARNQPIAGDPQLASNPNNSRLSLNDQGLFAIMIPLNSTSYKLSPNI